MGSQPPLLLLHQKFRQPFNKVFKNDGYPDDFISRSSKLSHHLAVSSIGQVSAEEESENGCYTILKDLVKT